MNKGLNNINKYTNKLKKNILLYTLLLVALLWLVALIVQL
jgi:hypothetical protein